MEDKTLKKLMHLLTISALCLVPHTHVFAKAGKEQNCQNLYKTKQYAKALQLCTKMAGKNDKEAQYYTGMLYLQGLGTQPHQELAFKSLLRAAYNQHPQAQYQVAKLYSLGLGTERNESEAAKWYNAAARNEVKEAILFSSLINRLGIGVPKNSKQALAYHQLAVEKQVAGLFELQSASFELYQSPTSEAGQQEFEQAMNLQLGLKNAANTDQSEVIRLLKQAAELGHPDALVALAECYQEGKGVTQNDFDAFINYKKAALLGHPEGIFQVSYRYLLGLGVPQDEKQAVRWLNQAKKIPEFAKKAPSTQTIAQKFSLNNHSELMSAITKIPATPEEKYKKALELSQENENNMANLKEAIKWYSESAQSGNKNAQYKLGMMYLTGKGLPQNYVYSYSWLNLSSAQGMPEANQAKIYLESKMTPEQLKEAQRLSEEVYVR